MLCGKREKGGGKKRREREEGTEREGREEGGSKGETRVERVRGERVRGSERKENISELSSEWDS